MHLPATWRTLCLQDAIKVAFYKAGCLADRLPVSEQAQPISPRHDSQIVDCEYGRGRNVLTAGDVRGDGGEVFMEGEVGGSEEVIESKEEEVDPVRIVPTPYQPSQQEVDEHCVDHVPYRCWCPHCINGFGREEQHRSEATGRSTPLISFDYLFLTRDGVFERNEWEAVADRKEFLRILVIRDGRSKALFAHAVPSNGGLTNSAS